MHCVKSWVNGKRFLFFCFVVILGVSLSASQSNSIFAQSVASSSATALQNRRTGKASTTMRTRGRWHSFNGYQTRLLRVSGPTRKPSKGKRGDLSAQFYVRDTKNRRNSRTVTVRQWREAIVGNIGISPTSITHNRSGKGRAKVSFRVMKSRRR